MFNVRNFDNDLFFVCWMIERIARKTHNKPKGIVNVMGKKNLLDMYKFANVMHCENPLAIEDEYIEECNITDGDFDNICVCRFEPPLDTAKGKTYMWLIMNTFEKECNWKDYETNLNNREEIIEKLIEVYNSDLADIIEDYNTTLYTESPQHLYRCYTTGDIY